MREIKLLSEPDLDTFPRNHSGNLLSPVYHESNIQGMGIMYRVINVPRLIAVLSDHNFNGQSCRLKLTIVDDFLPENNGSHVIHFENGRIRLPNNGKADVEIKLGIAKFSSMLLGVISFSQLHRYDLAQISEERYLDVITQLFWVAQRPLCLTTF